MANDETPAGFFSRWSRRKAEVRQGVALDGGEKSAVSQNQKSQKTFETTASDVTLAKTDPSEQKAPPTLSDVQSLTKDSDFTQFMSSEVAPEVKNAAMKKLFADPHFNVMDRMDVYIDDYGQPDPIPQAMLRQMVSAKFLNLFEDDVNENKEAGVSVNDTSGVHDPEVMAQSVPATSISNTVSFPNDHTDLRLQPDPAPRSEGTGPKSL
jgi:Protein of unknown function (DUF3306)